ncbi:flagellar motor protein MotB [Gemmatimonadetes bacterium T265]|nr:flagellar motor protein MotB [Gemmatimonadetes bacterium T265]
MAADKSKKIVIVRKKKVAGGGHHGGSWKVAYADFVTAMMAFFMVMWILGMDDKVKQAVEGYFSNPVGYKKGYGAGASPISSGASPAKAATQQVRILMRGAESQAMSKAAAQIKQLITGDPSLRQLHAKVEVTVTNDGLRIELVESGDGETFFPVGSTAMKPAAVIALQLIAPAVSTLGNPVVIEGHTDAATYGAGAAYNNWDLSAERANAARRVLEASGLPAARVEEVRGMADRRPRVPDDPYAAANRRISILLPYRGQAPAPDDAGAPELAALDRGRPAAGGPRD